MKPNTYIHTDGKRWIKGTPITEAKPGHVVWHSLSKTMILIIYPDTRMYDLTGLNLKTYHICHISFEICTFALNQPYLPVDIDHEDPDQTPVEGDYMHMNLGPVWKKLTSPNTYELVSNPTAHHSTALPIGSIQVFGRDSRWRFMPYDWKPPVSQFQQGQIVTLINNKNPKKTVMITDPQPDNPSFFSGVVITTDDNRHPVGTHLTHWVKDLFQ